MAAVDFQSKAQDPARLDIRNPILAKTLHRGEGEPAGESPGARDGKSLQAAYYAMIKLIDEQVGRMVAALERTGQRRKTVIIFTSDHGETLGDHGLIQKGCRFYEGLVRVPLIFSCPGLIQENLQSDALVELMDKAPTILELAGLPVPDHMQAKSLAPILLGQKAPEHHKDAVRTEFYAALDMPARSLATMYRNRRYKLVTYHQHEFGELYDLDSDPFEHNNLWDDEALKELRFELLKASFDATMQAIDHGPLRIGPM